MASEYYKKKFQDVKPDEPIEVTRKEQILTWWTYHWFYVVATIAAIVLVCCILFGWVFKVRSDYRVIYVGESYLSVDTEQLKEQLAQLGEDCNHDGRVKIQLNCYATGDANPNYESDVVAVLGDFGVGNSSIIIVDDPQAFVARYNVASLENCYAWKDCPALSHIDLGGDYYIMIRTDVLQAEYEKEPNPVTFWNALTQGAK